MAARAGRTAMYLGRQMLPRGASCYDFLMRTKAPRHLSKSRGQGTSRTVLPTIGRGPRASATLAIATGLTVSPDLEAALLVLEDAEQDARREVLAERCGHL